jgi:antirestriction protein ArdC
VLGLDKPNLVENQAAYLKNWRARIADDPQAFVWAAGRAEKAADMILGVEAKEEKADDAEES